MKRVERAELLDLGAYEALRERFRARIIALKAQRRVALGSNISVLFENHDTALWQIQEMLRTERITAESAIAHELETYNQLIPAAAELSATVFIEYPDSDERARMLTALAGIEDKFYLDVAGQRCPVRNETGAPRTDRTTAVHYVKFALTSAAVTALRSVTAESSAAVQVILGVNHASYTAHTPLDSQTVAQLSEDLA
jgi:hypothetical protein